MTTNRFSQLNSAAGVPKDLRDAVRIVPGIHLTDTASSIANSAIQIQKPNYWTAFPLKDNSGPSETSIPRLFVIQGPKEQNILVSFLVERDQSIDPTSGFADIDRIDDLLRDRNSDEKLDQGLFESFGWTDRMARVFRSVRENNLNSDVDR